MGGREGEGKEGNRKGEQGREGKGGEREGERKAKGRGKGRERTPTAFWTNRTLINRPL